ncbi:hypothetical protein BCR44DRAFT_1238180 [Catenaria anguillulae PL171]|uniref:Uncharacterized protein n=1 Tax=Catenaria anguillulae PL171 TaxID=765915 RepID=A0A1Y2HCY3_9FUNG|nr:hypothetical protein BCR44DRAFT_1238180 [Catenaria anguillulae PL171]
MVILTWSGLYTFRYTFSRLGAVNYLLYSFSHAAMDSLNDSTASRHGPIAGYDGLAMTDHAHRRAFEGMLFHALDTAREILDSGQDPIDNIDRLHLIGEELDDMFAMVSRQQGYIAQWWIDERLNEIASLKSRIQAVSYTSKLVSPTARLFCLLVIDWRPPAGRYPARSHSVSAQHIKLGRFKDRRVFRHQRSHPAPPHQRVRHPATDHIRYPDRCAARPPCQTVCGSAPERRLAHDLGFCPQHLASTSTALAYSRIPQARQPNRRRLALEGDHPAAAVPCRRIHGPLAQRRVA